MRNLAPIGVSTYIRLEHLKKTISALQKNTLAKDSRLFIFSDAAKPGDEEKVEIVREYLHIIKGFKEVIILERKENSRIKNNRGGISELLQKFGKCIFMEEDIVTAPGFLKFMNVALDFYQKDPSIFSITGYSPPFLLDSYQHDFYVLPRFNAWGGGFWQGKFESVKYIDYGEYCNFISNKKLVKEFVSAGGKDMLRMLELEVEGHIDAYDVKAMYYQFKNNMLTVYPKHSLVQNIGHDGTGVHCGITNKFSHKKLWDKKEGFEFIESPIVDELIKKQNLKFRSPSYKEKFIEFSKKIGIYPILKGIKDRL